MSDIDKTTGEGITPPWGDTPPKDLDGMGAVESLAGAAAGYPRVFGEAEAVDVLHAEVDETYTNPVARHADEHPVNGKGEPITKHYELVEDE